MNFERIKQLASIYENKIWDVKVWQEVEIHEKITDGKNTRIWRFKWLIIKVKNPNLHTWTFTVRGKVVGVDVEKVYPLSSTTIQKILLLDEKKVRRSKLYYIREKIGKDARLKSLLTGERSYERGKEIEKKDLNVAKITKEVETTATEETTKE